MPRVNRINFFLFCFFLTTPSINSTDLDIFAGTGNVGARTAYMRDAGGGGADKIWTPFSAYDSAVNLGVRMLQSYGGNFPSGQVGAEFSYFTASTRLPADRIVERWDLSNLIFKSSQPMTNDDRIRIDTGRASVSIGFSIPLVRELIFGEFGLLGGVGVGRVRDAVILQTNGREFNSYASMSLHWGFSLRLRVQIMQFLTVGAEYRYTEEVGKNLGSSFGSIISYRVDSNQFIGWVGYRFGKIEGYQ